MLNRAAGCRWAEYLWKGVRTVILENDSIRVGILADKGTDIVEFLYKPRDVDFMWRSPMPFHEFPRMVPTVADPRGSFLDRYPGGWQEVFPNAGGPCEYKGAALGLHGEVALLPWEYRVVEDTPGRVSLSFSVRTSRTPFRLEKTVSVERGVPGIDIAETVVNEASEEMDFLWGHHPAFGAPFLSADCSIRIAAARVAVVPGDGRSETNVAAGGRWPLVEGTDGRTVDLSRCPAENDRVSEIFFLSDLAEGAYEICNERLKLGFRLEFPLAVFRCLWFWRIARGSFHYPWFGRTYNVALEPFSSLPCLSDAVARGDQLTLGPGESLSADLRARVTEG